MCMVIVIHHSGFLIPEGSSTILPSGHLAADFFFITMGYFACVHLNKAGVKENPMNYSMGYTLNKLKRVFPYAVVGIIAIYLMEFLDFSNGKSFTDRIFDSQNIVYEILFIPMTGVMKIDLSSYKNAPLWFLSVMLIALPVIMYLYMRYKDVIGSYCVFIIPGILLCYLINRFEGLTWTDYSGLFFSGLIRGFADILLGFFVFNVSEIIKVKLHNKTAGLRFITTIIEVVLLIYILYSTHRFITSYDQVFVVYLIVVMLILNMSELGYTSLIRGKLFEEIGKIAMPVYCLHWAVYTGIDKYLDNINYYMGIVLCLLISIIISLIIKKIVYWFSNKRSISPS